MKYWLLTMAQRIIVLPWPEVWGSGYQPGKKPGKGAALECGIEHIDSEIILMLDGTFWDLPTGISIYCLILF